MKYLKTYEGIANIRKSNLEISDDIKSTLIELDDLGFTTVYKTIGNYIIKLTVEMLNDDDEKGQIGANIDDVKYNLMHFILDMENKYKLTSIFIRTIDKKRHLKIIENGFTSLSEKEQEDLFDIDKTLKITTISLCFDENGNKEKIKNIRNNNALIAVFMGAAYGKHNKSEFVQFCTDNFGSQTFVEDNYKFPHWTFAYSCVDDLKYNTSWKWLTPVILRIKKIDPNFTYNVNNIKSAYISVVNFIKKQTNNEN